jgi:hypothetical protein
MIEEAHRPATHRNVRDKRFIRHLPHTGNARRGHATTGDSSQTQSTENSGATCDLPYLWPRINGIDDVAWPDAWLSPT